MAPSSKGQTATAGLVYSVEAVCGALELPYTHEMVKVAGPVPAAFRGITFFHPGFSLVGQRDKRVIRDRKLLWVREDLLALRWAAARVTPGFYRVCLPAPDTGNLTFDDQVEAVRPFGEVACPVAIATMAWLVHKLATGESLFIEGWMRCAEVSSAGRRVELRPLAVGLNVFGYWDDDRNDGVRLASLGTSGEENLGS